DTGHLRFANHLVEKGLIDGDPLYQFCLGIPWGAAADAETLSYFKSRVPENGRWAAFGIGRMQIPMVAESVLQGGSVRVRSEERRVGKECRCRGWPETEKKREREKGVAC